MTTDWFRNSTWDNSIEEAFEERLRGSRRKEQYLRIQASTLADSHPEMALKLLARYFELPDDFDHAQAHVDCAKALLALGLVEDAISSYEAALAREAVFPKLRTQAFLDLPYLVATSAIHGRYDYALSLLDEHESRLMFPVDRFRWYASRALILDSGQESERAQLHARQALEAVAEMRSGFKHHPSVGLVTEKYEAVTRRLEAIASGV
jgi:tetratricopeptide (TPR) repeat protein